MVRYRYRKLSNTPTDIDYLISLLSSGIKPLATFELCGFTSTLASSMVTVKYHGVITGVDKESGQCIWENEQGVTMPSFSISVVTIYES